MNPDKLIKPVKRSIVRRFIRKYYPDLNNMPIKYHGGASFSVFSVGSSDLIFRFSKSDWNDRLDELQEIYEKENRIIKKIQKVVLPHKLPQNIDLVVDKEIFDGGIWITKRFEGNVISDLIDREICMDKQDLLTKLLGDFLSKFHSIDYEVVGKDIEAKKVSSKEVIEGWFRNFEDNKRDNFPLLTDEERSYVTKIYKRFLSMASDMRPMQRICHGDFEPDNCLLSSDESYLEVIDLDDITYGQAAGEFCSWYGYCGEDFVRKMLNFYEFEVDELFIERVRFYYQRIPLFYFSLAREYNSNTFLEYGRKRLHVDMKRFC